MDDVLEEDISYYDDDAAALIAAINRGEYLHSLPLFEDRQPTKPLRNPGRLIAPLPSDAVVLVKSKPLRLDGVAYVGVECKCGGYWGQTGPSELTWDCKTGIHDV